MRLEGICKNAGVPESCDQQFLQYARDIASEIGVPLAIHSHHFQTTKDFAKPLRFYPAIAACEYVDARLLEIVDSRAGYVFKPANCLSQLECDRGKNQVKIA
jgi:hypothetical protein